MPLRDCLRAIASLDKKPDELIVVDNTNGDRETEELARAFSATYLIEPAIGLSRARNLGLSASGSQIVAFLDDDAVPDKKWLEQIIEPFSDPNVAVVTGTVIASAEDGCSANGSRATLLNNKDGRWFEIAAFGGLGDGCNMALRKSACKFPEMFDERLGRGTPYHGMEENLAFTRILSHNHSAVHSSTALACHFSANGMMIRRDARNAVAYCLLLSAEFPGRRLDLLRFLIRRARREPLSWKRESPDPGVLINSNWGILLRASLSGAILYFRTKRRAIKNGTV